MRGFRREQLGPRDAQTNLGITEDHIDDAYYTLRLGPQDFGYLDGCALARIGANLLHTAVSFPDAATTQAYVEVHRPAYWIKGNLRVTFFYTGDTASTNNSVVRVRIGAVAAGGNLDAAGSVSAATTAAGPAVVGDEKSLAFTELFAVDASHRHIAIKALRLGADGSDNYAGEFQLTQLVAQFIPTGQQL